MVSSSAVAFFFVLSAVGPSHLPPPKSPPPPAAQPLPLHAPRRHPPPPAQACESKGNKGREYSPSLPTAGAYTSSTAQTQVGNAEARGATATSGSSHPLATGRRCCCTAVRSYQVKVGIPTHRGQRSIFTLIANSESLHKFDNSCTARIFSLRMISRRF